MQALRRWFVAACLVACTGMVHGADRDTQPMEIWLRARITLDDSGRMTAIEWLGTGKNAKPLTDRLEQEVRTWEFEPGKVGGNPALTETGLILRVTARERADGGLSLAIKDAHTGVASDSMPAPAYPTTQAMRGYSAALRLRLEIDETGKVASATVLEYAGDSKEKWSRSEFEGASLKAAKSWRFKPEQVAGKALRSQVNVPVSFCGEVRGWCADRDRQRRAEGQQVLPSNTAIALDSAVKIKTDFAATEI